MIVSLGIVFLVGLASAAITEKLKLPRIVGMLAAGMVCGPYVLNLLDPSILSISADLRKIALVIILIKAGLSLNLADLKQVGRPAVLMSFLPAVFEIIGYAVLAPMLFQIDSAEALLLGSVLAAVSPAVVVPRMVQLMETGYGTEKSIPQMILAGASCDDIFVIVLFSAFLSMNKGGTFQVAQLLDVPVSIVLGLLLGAVAGYLVWMFFETMHDGKNTVRNSMKVIIILGVSFLLVGVENALDGIVAVSGLLAVTAMAVVLKLKCIPSVSSRLSQKFGKIWLCAEVVLFVLVGAAVDIRYMANAGMMAVLLIFGALVFRTAGVWLSLLKTELTTKERVFCVMAYLPKATVQAAIGAVPLANVLSCGDLILSVAVLAIVITAPIGAFLIDHFHPIML
ncbi:MAG: cation:proton antiporter [Erysipelotrichaceae bacterium]|nr:cation:proton antiporter [Erysipelotrichaceae bacterium]